MSYPDWKTSEKKENLSVLEQWELYINLLQESAKPTF